MRRKAMTPKEKTESTPGDTQASVDTYALRRQFSDPSVDANLPDGRELVAHNVTQGIRELLRMLEPLQVFANNDQPLDPARAQRLRELWDAHERTDWRRVPRDAGANPALGGNPFAVDQR
jgi:hypothetical protein